MKLWNMIGLSMGAHSYSRRPEELVTIIGKLVAVSPVFPLVDIFLMTNPRPDLHFLLQYYSSTHTVHGHLGLGLWPPMHCQPSLTCTQSEDRKSVIDLLPIQFQFQVNMNCILVQGVPKKVV